MLKKCKTCGKVTEMLSWEEECSSCCNKRYYRTLREQIENGEITEVDSEDEVVCPYCGEVQEYDIDEYKDIYTEGTRQMQCHDCLNYFELTVWIEYYYGTQRINRT